MGPEERAGEAPVLFSDWTVSERQEQSWVVSGQDGTAGGEAEPQGSPFLGKPLCATGAPPKLGAQGVSGRLGILGLGIPTSSLPIKDNVLLCFP